MPRLVLLPGMDGTGRFFTPFLRALDGRCETQVLAYPETRPLGYCELAILVRDALPEQPYVLLAESFSGPLGISLAATSPPYLHGLILCATFASNPYPVSGMLAGALSFLPFLPFPGTAFLNPLLWGSQGTPELKAILADVMRRVVPAVWRRRLREVLLVNQEAALAGIDVPLLYLRASSDRIVPFAAGDRIRALKKESRLIDIDAPHLLLQCAAEEASEAIHEFLRTL